MDEPRSYKVTWNGEEYVATCVPLLFDARGDHVSGHSRHPVHALNALALKLVDMGLTVMPPLPPLKH